QTFLEQVGAPESRVGLGDPVELVALSVREVLGVLPEGVAGPLEGPSLAGRSARSPAVHRAAGLVPGLAANLVKGLGGPGNDMEGVRASQRVGATLGDHGGDPLGCIGADMGDLCRSLGPKSVEEPAQSGFVTAGCRPDQL